MVNEWKATLMGLAAIVLVAGAPARVHAIAGCGDINNDGTFSASDCLIIVQCLTTGCPAAPAGGFCGNGGGTVTDVLACGDMRDDHLLTGTHVLTGADNEVCRDTANHVPTLYDACHGSGPSVSCPHVVGTGDITASETWPAGCDITIEGTAFVGDSNGTPLAVTPVIRIQPGAVIHALTNPPAPAGDPATLIFLPGSHIDAQGTPSSPIILTSGKAPGTRAPGDWGGLEFLGKSTVNRPACTGTAEGIPLSFGGCINNDNSGIMSFVRVEFGGQTFTPNNELNNITFNAIGSTTQFNFLAAVAGDDDNFEWFGGTSNHHNLVSLAGADDNFDTQLGYTGSLQYAIAIQNKNTMQIGRDSRGIESDNSEFNPDATPIDFPINCNLTLIGGNKQAGANDGSDSGVLIRRGGKYDLANAIVQDFNDSGFEIRDIQTANRAAFDGTCTGGTRNTLPCSQSADASFSCPGGTCSGGDKIPDSLAGGLVVRSSVFYDNGSSAVVGAATEQAKDSDGTLDTTAGCDLGACAAANCAGDSESIYNLFVTGSGDPTHPVANACGSNATNTGISELYPADDNTGCTGLETPFTCCTGSGTGFCKALPNVVPAPTGSAFPLAFNCKNFSPILDTTTYIGAVNPAAPGCVFTGATAHCDWLSKPWIEAAIN